jgi:hypothetical protein
MKNRLALAAGWIAFYLADTAIYDGRHIRVVDRFVRAIGAGFGWVFMEPAQCRRRSL